MKHPPCLLALVLLASWLRAAEPAPELPPTPGWAYTGLRRVPAAEARQGVAADGEFFLCDQQLRARQIPQGHWRARRRLGLSRGPARSRTSMPASCTKVDSMQPTRIIPASRC
ncbi:MAG: hypothetical protein WDM96_16815 [Lacunisphaera sp.]